jgi:hypothetical protein
MGIPPPCKVTTVPDKLDLDVKLKTVTTVLETHDFKHLRNGSWVKDVAGCRIDVHLEPLNRTLVISQHRTDNEAKKMTIHVDLLQTDSQEWEKVLCCFDA